MGKTRSGAKMSNQTPPNTKEVTMKPVTMTFNTEKEKLYITCGDYTLQVDGFLMECRGINHMAVLTEYAQKKIAKLLLDNLLG